MKPRLRAANALVGNPAGTGALEVAYLGPTLVVEADDVRVAIVGVKADIEVLPREHAASGRRVDDKQSLRLVRGEALRIGALTSGTALYMAVEGGFDLEPVLGSVSTYMRGRLGGWSRTGSSWSQTGFRSTRSYASRPPEPTCG